MKFKVFLASTTSLFVFSHVSNAAWKVSSELMPAPYGEVCIASVKKDSFKLSFVASKNKTFPPLRF